MTPEEKARQVIDQKLIQSKWVIQDLNKVNVSANIGVAVREFPTSTGPVDYALFVDSIPVGVIEAKKDEKGEAITSVENQSARYAHSTFKWVNRAYEIRFVYEATSVITRFTDFHDVKYRSREIFSFQQPQTLKDLMDAPDTIRNNMKRFPALDTTGFRKCQIAAINNLEESFSENRPKALIQMATGAGKTFTAITASYRLLKYAKVNRILFLVDTRGLGEQAEREFMAYMPTDDPRSFSSIYGVHRLKSSKIPQDTQVYISTIQRMYSILRGEPLSEEAEEVSFAEYASSDQQKPKEVVYNAKVPPEFFDVIIVDECHRSIYNVWKQVLEYFDSFIIGLTATPDKRTFAYFHQNVVSEYTREQAIIDGVNVGEDIFTIETKIGSQGGYIMKQLIETRDRISRKKRWKMLDDDVAYSATSLDDTVVNPSHIRTIIETYKNALYTALFPNRKEVPKTLIFAKTDSHADDIVQTVREVFGEGNQFCQKITYAADNPEQILNDFRISYYPRIAVTVDMIATGTDVKPIECLIFMRDVRSRNFFEQMKGRGTRVMNKDDLLKVTPSAVDGKDHFVIVDAVGVTKSKKTETRTLERRPSVSLKELLMNVALGAKDEDTLTSLANRIIRLNNKMTAEEKSKFEKATGDAASEVSERLLDAFDSDKIADQAGVIVPDDGVLSEADEKKVAEVQKEFIKAAVQPFLDENVRNTILEIQKSHEQIIDEVNLDEVTYAGFATDQNANADKMIQSFREFIEENKDEILALRIIYDQKYKDRPMAIEALKALYEKLRQKGITIERLWNCYAIKKPEKVKKGTMGQITDLISIIRFEIGYQDELTPFADRVNYNFMQWTLKRNAGNIHFTDEQMDWLRMIKDHIVASLSITTEDLDLVPFDRKGGLLGFYDAFGDQYKAVLQEMNTELVA